MAKAIRVMHGLSLGNNGKRTPLHRLWLNLRNRCNNPKTPDYAYYGGRGIKVCSRWDVFENFARDVGPHPGKGWTLDRKDGDKDYEPGNVRWATRQTQSRNRKFCKIDKPTADTIRKRYHSGNYTQKELAAEYGVTQSGVSQIVRGVSWK